ncbi:hypothetical protein [Novosphingobium lindaniclasticum]|jgi:hypothetical protein|uniref:hypothetical protein n=1 Tax=Novosphingobium lindaniclasticum TaxID=1329895 RepID=UPI00240A4048|nr:hypothetical protein [Novosphingobium lindaniclasticum]
MAAGDVVSLSLRIGQRDVGASMQAAFSQDRRRLEARFVDADQDGMREAELSAAV